MKRIISPLAIRSNKLMLSTCILFLFATLCAQGQNPTASCAYCNRSSGVIARNGHAPSCRYYTPPKGEPKTQYKNPNPTVDPVKTLNDGVDLLLQTNDTTKDNTANDKKKNEELLKKKEEQKIKHAEGMKTLKPIETKMPEKPIKGSVMAVVASCTGSNIELYRNGKWQKITCSGLNNQIINDGDSLRTGKDNKIILITKEDGKICINPNTSCAFNSSDLNIFNLLSGNIKAYFLKYHKKFEVRTPTAVCGIRGTQVEIIVNIDNSTEISLFEGDVEIADINSKEIILKLTPGKKVKINPDGSIDTVEKILVNDFLKSFEE